MRASYGRNRNTSRIWRTSSWLLSGTSFARSARLSDFRPDVTCAKSKAASSTSTYAFRNSEYEWRGVFGFLQTVKHIRAVAACQLEKVLAGAVEC